MEGLNSINTEREAEVAKLLKSFADFITLDPYSELQKERGRTLNKAFDAFFAKYPEANEMSFAAALTVFEIPLHDAIEDINFLREGKFLKEPTEGAGEEE